VRDIMRTDTEERSERVRTAPPPSAPRRPSSGADDLRAHAKRHHSR
jgi:hypothetical protein